MAYIWKSTILLNGYFTQQEAIDACPDGYRLPTRKEFQNMINNTEYKFDWEKNAGIFTFSDGFKLELPAAGIRTIDGLSCDFNFCGWYWCSPYNTQFGSYLYFYGDIAHVRDKGSRNISLSVCI